MPAAGHRPPNITEQDVRPHRISYTLDRPADEVQAAYVALSEDSEWLLLHDHQYRVVAMVPKNVVALVQRVEPEPEQPEPRGRRARAARAAASQQSEGDGDGGEGHAE